MARVFAIFLVLLATAAADPTKPQPLRSAWQDAEVVGCDGGVDGKVCNAAKDPESLHLLQRSAQMVQSKRQAKKLSEDREAASKDSVAEDSAQDGRQRHGKPQWSGPVNFAVSTMTANNLGGQGPNVQDPTEMRFAGGVVVPGKHGFTCDVVMTTQGGYTPWNVTRNGFSGYWSRKLVQVNVKSGTSVDILVSFMKPGTSDLCDNVGTTFISVMDLDIYGSQGELESVVSSEHDGVFMTNDTEITEQAAGGKSVFSGSTVGVRSDNPTDAMQLDPQQARRAITFMYQKRAQFHFTLQVTPGKTGRNFVFGGKTSFAPSVVPPNPYPCPHHGPIDFDLANLTSNNLGGRGPNWKDAREMRFSGAVKGPAGRCDLVFEGESPYTPQFSQWNGFAWRTRSYAQINAKCGTNFDFVIKLTSPGTSEPCDMGGAETYITVLDLDEGKNTSRESIIARSHADQVIFTSDTELTIRQKGPEVWYSSTTSGTMWDNPTDPYKLRRRQAARSVTFVFARNTEMHFSIDVAKGHRGRNYLFAGASNLNCP